MNKGHVYLADGRLFMQCCPQCEKENWAPAVASGQCAYCHYVALRSDITHADIKNSDFYARYEIILDSTDSNTSSDWSGDGGSFSGGGASGD